MKKTILIFVLFSIFSCSITEKDHETKEAVRTYLKNQIHNPESFSENDWFVFEKYYYKETDTISGNLDLDIEETIKKEKKIGVIKNVILNYSSENRYGAIRKNTFYAVYFVKDKKVFVHENIKRIVLFSKFYLINSNNLRTFKEAYNKFNIEYPEFKK